MIEKLIPKRMRPEDKRFLALAVSAFVCPGAGQCMSGRWLMGIAFALGFVMAVAAHIILWLWPLLLAARAWLEEGAPFEVKFQWPLLIISFVAATLLYGWNLLDAWLQVRRDLMK